MALVAYDYDSNEESDNEEVNSSSDSKNKDTLSAVSSTTDTDTPQKVEIEKFALQTDDTISDDANKINLFSTLPQKQPTKEIEEDQIEDFIPKSTPKPKEKQKVKITIPSLSQFVDEDEPETKKIKPSAKGSGLISLLPPVRGSVTTTKSFVPNVVASKKKNVSNETNRSQNLVPHAVRKAAEVKKAILMKKIQEKKDKTARSDEESDDDIEMPETFDDEMWEKVCGRPKPKVVVREPEPEVSSSPVIDIAPEPEKQYDGLDNRAFKELVGKSKRPIGNIKLIDINEEEILADKDVWMMKSLTDPEMVPKKDVEDPVDPTKRRKHHITYLAQHAKANEQEFKNAWSASKNNRLATRAKYGF